MTELDETINKLIELSKIEDNVKLIKRIINNCVDKNFGDRYASRKKRK